MWLFGKVMFTENHVTIISALDIPMALEIASTQTADQIRQRSWGSAVLAATYLCATVASLYRESEPFLDALYSFSCGRGRGSL